MRVTWVQDEVDHVIAFLAAPPIARRLNASPVHLDGFTLAFRATSQGTTSRSQLGTSRSRLAGRCRCMRLLCRHLPLPRDLTKDVRDRIGLRCVDLALRAKFGDDDDDD